MKKDKIDKKRLIDILYRVIEKELEKPEGETDVELIADCADCLGELEAGDFELSDEEIRSRLNAIRARAEAEKKEAKEQKQKRNRP